MKTENRVRTWLRPRRNNVATSGLEIEVAEIRVIGSKTKINLDASKREINLCANRSESSPHGPAEWM